MKITDLNAIYPGLIPRSVSQISMTFKASDEQVCLADLKKPTVVWWLRLRDAALLTPIKDDTPFERQRSPARRSPALDLFDRCIGPEERVRCIASLDGFSQSYVR